VLEQAPGRTCGPVQRGAHAGAGLVAGLVTPWGTHAGAVHEELQPMGGTTLENFVEDCLLWEEPHSGAGAV